MANPLQFRVKDVDPKLELEKQLKKAPIEHGEALLVAYDILQTAHANGTLDLIQGLIGGRDIIAEKITHYAKMPGGISLIRNAIAGAKILMAFDPDTLDTLSKAVLSATTAHRAETKPPSLWTIGKRVVSPDSLRALSFLTLMLLALGKSLRNVPEHQ